MTTGNRTPVRPWVAFTALAVVVVVYLLARTAPVEPPTPSGEGTDPAANEWSYQVELSASISVGNQWKLMPFDTAAVMLVGEPETVFANPAIEGSTATQRWRFGAVRGGNAPAKLIELRFEYHRFLGESRDSLLEVKTFTVPVPAKGGGA